MRTRTVVAIGVLLAAMTGGCGPTAADSPGVATARSGGPAASTPATSASQDADDPVKYSRCMREHGMTWFPDPDSDGRMTVAVPSTVDHSDMKAAEEACREFSPFNGEHPRISAEDLERARQMARCMRENGVPNFPDPDPDGGIRLDGEELGTGPGQPRFDKAEQACSKFRPPGAHRERGTDGADEAGGGGA